MSKRKRTVPTITELQKAQTDMYDPTFDSLKGDYIPVPSISMSNEAFEKLTAEELTNIVADLNKAELQPYDRVQLTFEDGRTEVCFWVGDGTYSRANSQGNAFKVGQPREGVVGIEKLQ